MEGLGNQYTRAKSVRGYAWKYRAAHKFLKPRWAYVLPFSQEESLCYIKYAFHLPFKAGR